LLEEPAPGQAPRLKELLWAWQQTPTAKVQAAVLDGEQDSVTALPLWGRVRLR
jgi:hypothetical protein